MTPRSAFRLIENLEILVKNEYGSGWKDISKIFAQTLDIVHK